LTDVALVGLSIADPPERWAAVGFNVRDGRVKAHSVMLTLGIAPQGGGIVAWTLAGSEGAGDVGGLATRWLDRGSAMYRPAPAAGHGIRSLDHVVVATPVFDAFAAELDDRGIPLRRFDEVRGARMGFRRLGGPILEVVEAPEAEATAFWGMTFSVLSPPGGVDSLDELCARSRFVGEPRPAVQPGRRIATVAHEAGLSTRVAFIDPEPR
jgi:hypothetical protein